MERFYENDGLKVTFKINNGNLSQIFIDVKDNDLYPKLNEDRMIDGFNKRLVNDWLIRIYQFIENSLLKVPNLYSEEEKKALIDTKGITDVKIVRSNVNEMPPEETQRLIESRVCPTCNEKLISVKLCCGGKGSITSCPKCGRKYRVIVVNNPNEEIV